MNNPEKLAFKFIANACGIFTGKLGTRVLCDPWIVDGVFEGSWCHYPPLTTKMSDLKNIDALYVSHLHPDHFDERYFDFDKSIPIIVLDHGPNFLIKKLTALGYTNLIRIKDKETIQFKEFDITMFAPFVTHNFHEAKIGNLIDSAMLISCDGVSAFNANDNNPTVAAAQSILENYPPVTMAMLNYNAAGPFPSCFDNLDTAAKKAGHERVLNRNFAHMRDVVATLKPKFVLPFAGAYVIGGRFHEKNDYLGTTTWDVCAAWLKKELSTDTQVVTLRENDTFDLSRGESDRPYQPINVADMKRYIEENLSRLKYPYELDAVPEEQKLQSDIETASQRMRDRMKRFELESNFHVVLKAFGKRLQIYPKFAEMDAASMADLPKYLECSMDEKLLRQILDRKAHWNNAEIGTHISFFRQPDFYEPDLHTSLQFFHL